MRDDRIGGLERTDAHWKAVSASSTLFAKSLAEKAEAAAQFQSIGGCIEHAVSVFFLFLLHRPHTHTCNMLRVADQLCHWQPAFYTHARCVDCVSTHGPVFAASEHGVWQSAVKPHLTDLMQRDRIGATVTYGAFLFAIVDASWRIMAQGYLKQHPSQPVHFNATMLATAIEDYDVCTAMLQGGCACGIKLQRESPHCFSHACMSINALFSMDARGFGRSIVRSGSGISWLHLCKQLHQGSAPSFFFQLRD